MTDFVIVGGGISGLAAAWELSADPSARITVLEGSPRLGGKIRTETFAGRQVDLGPDAFLRRVPEALTLCDELGLHDLIAPAHGTAKVWLDGTLQALPAGLVLGVPARFDDLETSGILSADGLARARAETTLAGLPITEDLTVGALIRSRYGDELADRIVGPLLGGIAAGNIDEMSVDASVPQLAVAARNAKSITKALATTPAAAAGPVFAAPHGGMGVLIDTLVRRLGERGVEFRLNTTVSELPEADGVIITTAAPVTADLLTGRCDEAAELLRSIEHASVVFTAVAYRAADLPEDLDGSGFLVPRTAGLSITAASWSSSKWAHLAGDPVILRVSMGHTADPAAIDLPDDAIAERIATDLHTTMGITAAPTDIRINRFWDGFPQYRPGHLDRTAMVEAHLAAQLPHVEVAGMAHRGVGIPACVREARAAARRLRSRTTSPDRRN
ncbi:MAG: protoporphyrinogen oxidase [Actinobacteria bacterium]|nr:protoporphyrinogen oxidase [Actinomycetota bacterium]